VTVRRVGSGPDVLFVHGVYVNGAVWDEVVERLADKRTCWIPTLPLGGHDAPLEKEWKPTLDELAALVPAMLEELDLSDVTLVGNDSGGGLILLALGRDGAGLGRVGRVVLTNCDSFDHLPPKAFGPIVALCRGLPAVARGLLRLMLYTSPGQTRFLRSVSRRRFTAEQARRFFGVPAAAGDAVRVTAALKPSATQQAMAWLGDVHLPISLVWGDADKFFPRSDGERLAASLRNVATTWVSGAKTYVQLDDPQAVADVITGST
jgi:pimeloyl-ACP methyl ester carboxylesterase